MQSVMWVTISDRFLLELTLKPEPLRSGWNEGNLSRPRSWASPRRRCMLVTWCLGGRPWGGGTLSSASHPVKGSWGGEGRRWRRGGRGGPASCWWSGLELRTGTTLISVSRVISRYHIHAVTFHISATTRTRPGDTRCEQKCSASTSLSISNYKSPIDLFLVAT